MQEKDEKARARDYGLRKLNRRECSSGEMKRFLSQKGIQFTAKNIREDQQALEELLKLGVRATPVTVIDGEVIVGFDRGKIERLLGIT